MNSEKTQTEQTLAKQLEARELLDSNLGAERASGDPVSSERPGRR